jgi:hypothetical protein
MSKIKGVLSRRTAKAPPIARGGVQMSQSEVVNEITEATRTSAQKFASAYAEWMEATATVAKMDAGSSGWGDEEADAAIDRLAAAERQLIFTAAIGGPQLLAKLEVLEMMLSDREQAGRTYENRHMLMFTSVKADLVPVLQHGVGVAE